MKHARTLGLVVIATAAFTAFVATSSASAAQFKSNSTPVMVHGEQSPSSPDVIKIDGQPIECTKAVLEQASLTTPANTLPLSATYSGCSSGFSGWNINMGNCYFELLQPNAELRGNLAIRCSGANNIIMKSFVLGGECEVSIGEAGNTNLPSVGYSNLSGRISMSIGVNGITANKLKDNLICLLSGTGETKNMAYNGPLVLEGTSGIGISVG